ncbi:MAG: hypothetical protein EOM20_16885, partial [Spartobacteria bacterium]|nr:hypothetical protein [Spartobacteria bacterium]
MKMLCAVIVLLIAVSATFARDVDEQTALRAVNGWLAESPVRLGDQLDDAIAGITPYEDLTGRSVGYLVNLRQGGFIIVSANDLIEPIIA